MKSKIMRQILVSCAAVAIAAIATFVVPSVANATLATSLLWTDGATINNLEDVDYESLQDNSTVSLQVDVGDYLFGIWQISDVFKAGTATKRNPGPGDSGNDYFTAVFALQVLAKENPAGTKHVYGLGAIPWDGTGTDPFKTLTGFDRVGYSTVAGAGSVAIVYSDPDGLTTNALSEVNGTPLWEWGFISGLSYASSSDLGISGMSRFWVADSSDDDFTASPLAVSYIAAMDVTNTYLAGLPLLDHNWGGSQGFSGNEADGSGNKFLVFPSTGAEAPVHLLGAKAGTVTGSLPLLTDSDIFVRPTPEPGAWVALVGLAVMGLFGAWRSRRSN